MEQFVQKVFSFPRRGFSISFDEGKKILKPSHKTL